MNNIKSHFQFTKRQRNGIFLLLVLIILVQGVLFFGDFKKPLPEANSEQLMALNQEWDSLRKVQIENLKPKWVSFNPNFITDHKGYTLGMSNEEIDRLLTFRRKNQWINSAQQFQQVTGVSDSLLNVISPYFKFPEWVAHSKIDNKQTSHSSFEPKVKSYSDKADLNKATALQLKSVNGIGDKLAERIIKYRNKFEGGFINDIQLEDVYGLSPEVIERVLNDFTVKTPRYIEKIPLNLATKEQLVTIQHIDYDIAHQILEERTLREGFKSLDELTKVKGFPVHKIEIIKLYLTLD